MIPSFVSLSTLLLFHARRAVAVDKQGLDNKSLHEFQKRIPPDPRILQCCEEELDEQPKYVLDLGSGYGDRARLLAEAMHCVVVPFECSPTISFQASEETKLCGLSESVWHVRCDPQLSIDAQDVIEGQFYDVVIVSASFARKRGALAWAALALREGGVMIVEGDLRVYEVMKNELGLDLVRVCRGGTLESIEGSRRVVRERIASISDDVTEKRNHDISSVSSYDVSPYLLICGTRTASQAPLSVRPRTLSAITFTPVFSSPRPRTQSTLFEKPSASRRRRDHLGRRLRAGCVCICRSSFDSEELDLKRIVLVSSSKRLGEWIIPAGGLEEGEEPESAAVREAFEESGSQARVLGPLCVEEDPVKNSVTQYFLLAVDHFEEEFPEKANRRLALVHIDDAALHVSSVGSKNALIRAKAILTQKKAAVM